MKPIDYRNETWQSLQGRLSGLRAVVLNALRVHGPCTTRQLAHRARIDPFTVRPRITELVQLGFATLADDPDDSSHSREGIYRACTEAEARAHYQAARDETLGINHHRQLHLL